MILAITTTHQPATDLGFLLHKHPERLYCKEIFFGKVFVFYTEADTQRCTAVLYGEVDSEFLLRSKNDAAVRMSGMERHVNNLAYAASSLLCVAMVQAFSSAMNGHSRDRPELVDQALPLEVVFPVMPCRGNPRLLHDLFEPLGYAVSATRLPLDPLFPEWGESQYFHLKLSILAPLQVVFSQLYIMIPVLDNYKHYWIDQSEIQKLMQRGEKWLAIHPLRELIVRRYLKYQPSWTGQVAELLIGTARNTEEKLLSDHVSGGKRSLKIERLDVVFQEIQRRQPVRVIDLGCGAGELLERLIRLPCITRLTGVDLSTKALRIVGERLTNSSLPAERKGRVTWMQGSLLYRDERFAGYDLAVLMEVVEHLHPDRLDDFVKVVFGEARPGVVLLTTPNREYNHLFPGWVAGTKRHQDHRFEWSRAELREWATDVGNRFDYRLEFRSIGHEHAQLGSPTQMVIFETK